MQCSPIDYLSSSSPLTTTVLTVLVDEIICHPFFLSPDGRHVSEDIPEIINGAIESLNIEVPIVTTKPTGADMNIMVQVVQSICDECLASRKEVKG